MELAMKYAVPRRLWKESSNSTSLKRMVSSTKDQDYIQWETQVCDRQICYTGVSM